MMASKEPKLIVSLLGILSINKFDIQIFSSARVNYTLSPLKRWGYARNKRSREAGEISVRQNDNRFS